MSFTLYIDRQQWSKHLAETDRLYPGYLPVIKGNGYGFGNSFLADAMSELGKKSVAVGTLEEARQISSTHAFEQILILTPVLTEITERDLAFVFTVGSFAQLEQLSTAVQNLTARPVTLPPIKLLLKCRSAMKRYGFDPGELKEAAEMLRNNPSYLIQGYSLHFPTERIGDSDKLQQIQAWVDQTTAAGFEANTIYVSHLSPNLYHRVAEQHPAVSFVMRLGTSLWLKDNAYYFRSTVLDVRQVARGERYGYKQKKAWRKGFLVSVSGGTANGIGLESPVHARGLKGRLKLSAFWLLSLFNLHLSPFVYAGKRLWFAEPPHMQASILKLRANPPKPGDEVTVKNLRMTIAVFDQIVQLHARAAEPENKEITRTVHHSKSF